MDEHIHESIRHLSVRVDLLVPDPKNARKRTQRNLSAIKNSLERFGFRQPIVVQKQGMVVRVGNGRLQVAKELGWPTVPCLVVDEADAEATAYALMDNRSGELSTWDGDMLSSALVEMVDAGEELDSLGWEHFEVSPMVGDVEDYGLLDLDEEKKKPTKSETAGLWAKKSQVLKFKPEQWEELLSLLGGKPTPEAVLSALRGSESPSD